MVSAGCESRGNGVGSASSPSCPWDRGNGASSGLVSDGSQRLKGTNAMMASPRWCRELPAVEGDARMAGEPCCHRR